MQSLTCPLPQSINPLKTNGFILSITKLPLVSFFSQTAEIPGMSLPPASQDTPFSKVYDAGDKLEFDALTLTFIVDEKMNNFYEINAWLIGLGFPEGNQQYTDFLAKDTFSRTENNKNFSDGILTILDNNNVAIRELKFVDLVPVRLESVMLSSTNNDTIYMAGKVTFNYNYYEFI